MKYKTLIGIVLLFLPSTFQAYGQIYERVRYETKSFKVYDNTSLEISNKYGNIHLFNWDKDSVQIDIDVKIKVNKEAKADKIFEFIDFEFTDSKFYIIARTTFGQNQGSFWAEISDLANTVFSGNNKAQIDYNIYLPSNIDVRLEDKFGNIYCTDHKGKMTVSLSNGDFKANKLSGEINLDMSFGNIWINHIENGKVKGSYLEMDLGSAVELFVESKSSTYNIEKIGMLNVQSRRDKFYIDEISSISGKTSFSYLTIKGFSKYLKLATDYGEIKVKGVSPDFKMVELESKYTDIIIQLSSQINCAVDVKYTEATGVKFPVSFNGNTVTEGEKKETRITSSGFLGKKEDAKGKINISIESGNVSIQEDIPIF